MTKSEQICNEIGAKFFSKDYTYENLKFFNSKNNRVELCDGLFEYAGIYIPLQIKERTVSSSTKSSEQWLNETVYEEAVRQVGDTIKAIRENDIKVNDYYHQPVEINKKNLIFPIIIFDNSEVTSYKRVIKFNDVKINILSLNDYRAMMEVLVLPYDIIYYLQERANWVDNGLPHFVFGEGENTSIISRIESEEDFARFFSLYTVDGDKDAKKCGLEISALIAQFRENQLKKSKEYKKVLDVLQLIEPKVAPEFMKRFWYAWKAACADKFDYSKSMQIILDEKRISIVFFAVGWEPILNKRFYEVLIDAKQLQQEADAVLVMAFIGDEYNKCEIDWIYQEKPYKEDIEALNFYNSIEMFNNSIMDRKMFDELCNRMLSI